MIDDEYGPPEKPRVWLSINLVWLWNLITRGKKDEGKDHQMVLKMSLPAVTKMAKDMIKSVDITGMRDVVITKLTELAEKTNTGIDDKMVDAIVPILFTPEHIADFGRKVLPPIRAYVIHSASPWDDKIFLPILDELDTLIADEAFDRKD